MQKFNNANEAFEFYLIEILEKGISFSNTQTLFDIGFLIENPTDRIITNEQRNFSTKYAEREWKWYESGDPCAKEISKHAPIWKNHMDENGKVQSNYGWQWLRKNQINKALRILEEDNETRKCVISFYDGKEIDNYKHDTPCTTTVQFHIVDNKLNMSVHMRSNDLWFGFCNDQYMFSKLLEMCASRLSVAPGTYYHQATNLHLYNNKIIDKQLWKNLI